MSERFESRGCNDESYHGPFPCLSKISSTALQESGNACWADEDYIGKI